MILGAFSAALGQLPDRRFRRVVLLGIGLALALLAATYGLLLAVIDLMAPETLTLPWVGEIHWLQDLLGWGSLLLMAGLSIFLMAPVAALFSGLFLDDVAQAVEDRHYPALPPAPRRGFYDGLVSSVNLFGVIVAVNLLALLAYPFAGPFAPVVFWVVNGYLLGREYFLTVAERRLDRPVARAMRKANAGRIWLAGVLMAAPLSVPVVNLVIPVLGVATFTHLYHRLAGDRSR